MVEVGSGQAGARWHATQCVRCAQPLGLMLQGVRQDQDEPSMHLLDIQSENHGAATAFIFLTHARYI